jgi:HlyD family secretion protein
VIADDSSNQEFVPDKDGFVEIVWIIKKDKTVAKQVKTGIQSETHIEILEGLLEKDEIVIGNYRAISQLLQNGSSVVVKNEQ